MNQFVGKVVGHDWSPSVFFPDHEPATSVTRIDVAGPIPTLARLVDVLPKTSGDILGLDGLDLFEVTMALSATELASVDGFSMSVAREGLATELACSHELGSLVDSVVSFDVTVGAQEFKPFGMLLDLCDIDITRRSDSFGCVVKMECPTTPVISTRLAMTAETFDHGIASS